MFEDFARNRNGNDPVSAAREDVRDAIDEALSGWIAINLMSLAVIHFMFRMLSVETFLEYRSAAASSDSGSKRSSSRYKSSSSK